MRIKTEDYSKPNLRQEIHRLHWIPEWMQVHFASSTIRKPLHNPDQLQDLRIPTRPSKNEGPKTHDLLRAMLLQQDKGKRDRIPYHSLTLDGSASYR